MECALPECTEQFEPNRSTQIYHSQVCSKAAANRRQRRYQQLLAPVEGEAAPPPPRAPVRQHPAGWEPGVEWRGHDGTVTSYPMAAAPDSWNDLLAVWDLNPELYEVVEPVQFRAWDAAIGDGNVQRMYYYRATVQTRRPSSEEERAADVEAILREIRSRKRQKPAPGGSEAFVVNLSDWQIGKGEGDGSGGTADRLLAMIDAVRARYTELRKIGRELGALYVAGVGDLVEQCTGNYSTQTFTTDLNNRDQRKVVRRLLVRAIREWAPDFERVVVLAVGGNHGEERANGKKITDDADNRDVAVFEDVAEVIRAAPGLEHVSFVLPDDELVVVLDVAGTIVGWTHMHQAGGGSSGIPQAKALRWWGDQSFGRQPVADAQVLVSGHYHHFSDIEPTEGRRHLQCPAMDPGSKWFRDLKGVDSAAATLTFVTGSGRTRDVQVVA